MRTKILAMLMAVMLIVSCLTMGLVFAEGETKTIAEIMGFEVVENKFEFISEAKFTATLDAIMTQGYKDIEYVDGMGARLKEDGTEKALKGTPEKLGITKETPFEVCASVNTTSTTGGPLHIRFVIEGQEHRYVVNASGLHKSSGSGTVISSAVKADGSFFSLLFVPKDDDNGITAGAMDIYLKDEATGEYSFLSSVARNQEWTSDPYFQFSNGGTNADKTYIKYITVYGAPAPVVETLSATIDDETKVITATVAEDTAGVLIFAGYNGSVLETAKYYDVTAAGLTETFNASGYTTARVFLWDSFGTMIPLVDAKPFTITQ